MQPDIKNSTIQSPQPANPANALAPSSGTCENCGAPLYGRYCYACGQPVQGMVRHFSSVVSDIFDSVLNIDERIFKTLGPLYLQPGKLTLDYFAGKRARYVTPFRLVFFLAIVAFLALQLSFRMSVNKPRVFTINGSGVHAETLQTLPKTQDTQFADGNIRFNGKVIWNARTHPLHVGRLPDAVNDWLNGLIEHARVNLHQLASGDPTETRDELRHLIPGMFSVAPTVLFVLLPLFALLLKIFYVFKRRLYMEHLIVAMHSHAFLMLSMLVLVALGALHAGLQPHAGWLAAPVSLLIAAAWIWIFVYLFLMQKRVYRQGWAMTAVKYWCIGWCYAILAISGMLFAFLMTLTGA